MPAHDTTDRQIRSTLSTQETADVIGGTYRQVDYLTRTARVPIEGRGSGSRTRWPVDLVRALFVAMRVCDVIGGRDIEGGYSRFPVVVESLMRVDYSMLGTLGYGWLVVHDGDVTVRTDAGRSCCRSSTCSTTSPRR
jgi:hypothetical protein